MEKTKLILKRTKRGFTQQQMALKLNMDVSNYNRREKGQIKITNNEWEKLSKILDASVEEIYESEENNFFIFRDNVIGDFFGTNHFYTIPEYLLDNQRKYIQKLEEENRILRDNKDK
ncbi:multiprotein-bridging factor 1 family protein [Flavobacterium sp.]|uniref:helix-turn-helix domain-containing protein n=1 Tax=Flavobacterium sp. TaxID=239 RepID=UPI003750FE95